MYTDYEEIRRLTIDYCWFADMRDVSGIVELFGGDYCFDAQEFGIPLVSGRDALHEFFGHLLPNHECSQHISSNHRIDIDGAAGQGTSYYFMVGIAKNHEPVSAAGFYEDAYVRTEDGWRISRRRGVPLLPPEMSGVLTAFLRASES